MKNQEVNRVYGLKGELISHIKAKGAGPEEYAWIADFDLLPDQDQIVVAENRKMAFYSIDGRFIEKQPIPLKPMNIAALGDDCFAFAPGRLFKGRTDSAGNYQLIITNRQGRILDRKFEFPHIIINDGDLEFQQNAAGNANLFALTYDLHIYEAGPGAAVRAKYTVDFGSLNPDTGFLQKDIVVNNERLYEFNDGKMLKPYGIAETSNTLLIRCGSDKHQKVAWRLIDRRTGFQRTVVMEERPKLGYFHGWPIYPYMSSTGDYIFHLLTAMDILENLQTLSGDQKQALSGCEGFNRLAGLKEDDNPVVVLYKLQ